MFRLSSLAVALTLALGPTAGLLCRSVCDPQTAASTGCHHPDARASVGVASSVECDTAVLVAAALPREEIRRAAAPHDAGHAITPARAHVGEHLTPLPVASTASSWRQLDRHPLSTILRI